MAARGDAPPVPSTFAFIRDLSLCSLMPLILGIESTCDETAAAVVEDGTRVRSSVVATQVELHEKYRGVVPEIASRAHIENILPVLREAVTTAGVALHDLDAVAVAHRPGKGASLSR